MMNGFNNETEISGIIKNDPDFPGDPNSDKIYFPVIDTK